ncbi:MAG: ArnT family glycosyltransferase [Planctomycetia bacterium]
MTHAADVLPPRPTFVDAVSTMKRFAVDAVGRLGPVGAAMLLAAALVLPGLGTAGDLDGHEVLVAVTARAMERTGDWVVPRFAGEIRLQKPPLAYWLAAASYRLTGRVDPFAARLPSALAAVATAGLLAVAASRWFGPTVGWYAGLAQASSFGAVVWGRQALVDGVLTLLVAAAVLLGAYDRFGPTAPSRRLRRWAAVGFGALCGLAVLAKGPVGVAFIVPAVALYRLLRSRRPNDRPLLEPVGAALGAMIFTAAAVAWPAAVAAHRPDAAGVWYDQSVARFLDHWGPQTRPFLYYVYITPMLTLPWSLFWIAALVRRLRAVFTPKAAPAAAGDKTMTPSTPERRDALLLFALWFGVGFLLLTVSQGKRQHYILPVLPPLAVFAGLTAAAVVDQSLPARRRAATGLTLGAAVVLGVAAFQVFAAPSFFRHAGALALVARNRDRLDAAPCVVQFGSTDRWPAFPIDRPMRWPRDAAELQSAVRSQPAALVWTTREDAAAAFAALAAVGPYVEVDRSPDERDPDEQWILAAPR